MTRRQIDASREARLWFVQVIVPIAGVVALCMGNPEIKEKAQDVANKTIDKVKTFFNKEK